MYKFEISADTPQELQDMILEFAHNTVKNNNPSTYIDDDQINFPFEKTPPPYPPVTVAEIVPVTSASGGAPAGALLQPPPITALAPPEIVPLTSPTGNTVVGSTDNRGMPWDARIHSSSKELNKDGSWRNKRGVDKTVLKQIEQELLNSPQIVAVPLAVPPPPPAAVHVEMPTFDDRNKATPWENVVPTQAVPSQPVAQPTYDDGIKVPQGTRPAHSLSTFKNNLTVILADLINEGKITKEYIQELQTYFKVKNIWNVLGSEAGCIELYNTFGQAGLITMVDQ